MTLPPGLRWETWRIVSSERFSVTLEEVQTRWSLIDLLDAHATLDLLEEVANRPKGKSSK